MNSVTLEWFFICVARNLIFGVGGLFLGFSKNIVTLEWFVS